MAFYPLFRWLRDGSGKSILKSLGDFLALPGAVYLLALPVAWALVSLDPSNLLARRDFGGWPLPIYIFFFIYGFIVVSHEALQNRIQQLRWVSFTIATLCVAALFGLWGSQGDPTYGTVRYVQVFGIFGIASWCWILTFFGFGLKLWTQSKPILAYANEAVLPFYVLHQTVLLSVGYFVVQWQIPDALKWIIIAAISFAIILALYEFAIRRFNVLRFLFGMRPLPHPGQRLVKMSQTA